MRNNNSDYNSEAVKIANALKPMFKTWFDEWARSCVRVKKMTVSTAPSNGIVGVKDAFSDKEIFAKYTPSVANAKVGDTVWCRWYFDNMQTLYASDMGNVSSADASFDNATINNDLSVYGDFSIGSATLTETALANLLTIDTTNIPRTAFTPTAGQSYSPYGGCWYERHGKVCIVHIGISGLTANTDTAVFALPAELIPTANVVSAGIGYALASTDICRMFVFDDGSVHVLSQSDVAQSNVMYFAL